MPTYLIEIPHSENVSECKNVIRLFLSSGSHLISKAHWGCKDGVHKLWFIYEFDSKAAALQTIPSFLRPNASITELVNFSVEDMPQFMGHS